MLVITIGLLHRFNRERFTLIQYAFDRFIVVCFDLRDAKLVKVFLKCFNYITFN